MNEELMNNEVIEVEETTYYEPERGNVKGKLIKVGVIGVLAAGGIALAKHKLKDKIKERQVRKLEKDGYVVYTPDEVEAWNSEENECVAEEK